MRTSAPNHPFLSLDITLLAVLLSTISVLLLTGCGIGPGAAPSPAQGAALHGHVHGGQQAVAGAKVYLLAAATAAYGVNSVSLLNPLVTGHAADSIGSYVLTDSLGDFAISGDYTCTIGQLAYLLVRGGDSGGGTNSAIGLMTALGSCTLSGFVPSTPFIEINEVSTVAAAYALSGFATSDSAISDDESNSANTTALVAHAGLANAFANTTNLADLGTGAALATTPAGNSTVPQATINSLANILAACVNTADPVEPTLVGSPQASSRPMPDKAPSHSLACNTLFGNSVSLVTGLPGTTSSAAINIAHNPTANISALYPLAATKPPFSPALTVQPADFTLTLSFTPPLVAPYQLDTYQIVFDASGDLWYTYFDGGLAELTPLGAASPGSPYSDVSLEDPESLAIDASGNLWIADFSAQTLTQFNSSGSLLQSQTVSGFDYPSAIAIDPSGDLWVANSFGDSVTKLSPSGSLVHTYTNSGLYEPSDVLSDPSGDIWTDGISNFVVFQTSGTPASFSPVSEGGLYPTSAPQGFAFDASRNLWFIDYDASIGAISSAGVALPGTPFYPAAAPDGYVNAPNSMTLDGLGNSWSSLCWQSQDDVHTGSPHPLSAHPNDYDPSQTCFLDGFSSTGAVLLGSTYSVSAAPHSIAIDPSGDLWYSVSNVGFFEVVGLAAPVVTPLSAAVTANKIATLP